MNFVLNDVLNCDEHSASDDNEMKHLRNPMTRM